MAEPEPTDKATEDDLEATVDETIALCGGDPRAAVKALLVANAHLEWELSMTTPVVSYGFSRGWHRQRSASAASVEPSIGLSGARFMDNRDA